jgi:hypothetical protein
MLYKDTQTQCLFESQEVPFYMQEQYIGQNADSNILES